MCKQPFQNKIPSRPCFNPSIKKNQNGIVRFIGYRVFGDGPAAVHNLNSNRKPGFVIHITGLSSSAFHHNLSTCSWEVIYPMIYRTPTNESVNKRAPSEFHTVFTIFTKLCIVEYMYSTSCTICCFKDSNKPHLHCTQQ